MTFGSFWPYVCTWGMDWLFTKFCGYPFKCSGCLFVHILQIWFLGCFGKLFSTNVLCAVCLWMVMWLFVSLYVLVHFCIFVIFLPLLYWLYLFFKKRYLHVIITVELPYSLSFFWYQEWHYKCIYKILIIFFKRPKIVRNRAIAGKI